MGQQQSYLPFNILQAGQSAASHYQLESIAAISSPNSDSHLAFGQPLIILSPAPSGCVFAFSHLIGRNTQLDGEKKIVHLLRESERASKTEKEAESIVHPLTRPLRANIEASKGISSIASM